MRRTYRLGVFGLCTHRDIVWHRCKVYVSALPPSFVTDEPRAALQAGNCGARPAKPDQPSSLARAPQVRLGHGGAKIPCRPRRRRGQRAGAPSSPPPQEVGGLGQIDPTHGISSLGGWSMIAFGRSVSFAQASHIDGVCGHGSAGSASDMTTGSRGPRARRTGCGPS